MSISADLYRAFYGVGLHLSFSKAAREAGVSQSAISQSVKQLEKELNIPLFERTTKSVSFTPAGRELFDSVAQAFTVLDNGVTQLKERLANDQASVKIAATDTLCRYYLLPYFQEWQEKYADVGIQITNRPSPQCVKMVEEREAQIAIVNGYDELMLNPKLEVMELDTLRDVFVGGPKYKNHGRFTMEALLKEPVLLLEKGAASRTFFDDLTLGALTNPAFELSSLDVLMDFVSINMGISLVPDLLLGNKLKTGEVVELKTNIPVPERKIVLVRSRLQPLTVGADKFTELLMKNR